MNDRTAKATASRVHSPRVEPMKTGSGDTECLSAPSPPVRTRARLESRRRPAKGPGRPSPFMLARLWVQRCQIDVKQSGSEYEPTAGVERAANGCSVRPPASPRDARSEIHDLQSGRERSGRVGELIGCAQPTRCRRIAPLASPPRDRCPP